MTAIQEMDISASAGWKVSVYQQGLGFPGTKEDLLSPPSSTHKSRHSGSMAIPYCHHRIPSHSLHCHQTLLPTTPSPCAMYSHKYSAIN